MLQQLISNCVSAFDDSPFFPFKIEEDSFGALQEPLPVSRSSSQKSKDDVSAWERSLSSHGPVVHAGRAPSSLSSQDDVMSRSSNEYGWFRPEFEDGKENFPNLIPFLGKPHEFKGSLLFPFPSP